MADEKHQSPGGQGGAGDDAAFFRQVMDLAAARGWRRLSLADIAAEAGLSLAELRERHGGKAAILAAFTRHIDAAALAGDPDPADSVRDRLFDILMRRFDALRPYRDGLAVIVREGGGGGIADAVCGGQRILRSMAWMLEAAGVSSSGLLGRARTKGLALVYAGAFMTWLRDDTEDMSRTMAVLDRNLARAERFATMSPACRRPAPGAEGYGAAPGADPGTDPGPTPGGGPPGA